MRAVFCVEAVQIRGVLEIVGVIFAFLHHIVGLNVIIKHIHLQSDAGSLQNGGHGVFQNFSMGRGAGSDFHGGTCQSGIVHRSIVAVAGQLSSLAGRSSGRSRGSGSRGSGSRGSSRAAAGSEAEGQSACQNRRNDFFHDIYSPF